MADKMQFWAAMGHPCAEDLVADKFIKEHPEYSWTRDILRDMKTYPWAIFTAGAR